MNKMELHKMGEANEFIAVAEVVNTCPYLANNCNNVYKGRDNGICHTEKHTGCVDYKTIKFGEMHN